MKFIQISAIILYLSLVGLCSGAERTVVCEYTYGET